MFLSNIYKALLKFFLVFHINNALILELIEFFLISFTLASVLLTHFLLLVEEITPLRLDSLELFLDALSVLLHFLEKLQGHLDTFLIGRVMAHV
jgi:hypothetical protein